MIIADYQYKSAFSMDSEINFVACLTEIMKECQFIQGLKWFDNIMKSRTNKLFAKKDKMTQCIKYKDTVMCLHAHSLSSMWYDNMWYDR